MTRRIKTRIYAIQLGQQIYQPVFFLASGYNLHVHIYLENTENYGQGIQNLK